MKAHALRVLSGKEIDDWDLHWLCEENQFYKQQLNALLMEPFKQHDYEAEQAANAARVAAIQHRKALANTCRSYRSTRVARAKLHRNRYPMLLRLRRNEQEKQKLWDRFLISVLEYRTLVALDCIDRRHAAWQTNVIWSSSPYQPTTEYPFGSKCAVELIQDPNWVDVKAPEPATAISVERSLRDRLATYERKLEEYVYKEQFGIKRPSSITVTTTLNNERITRPATPVDTNNTKGAYLGWMASQQEDEIPEEGSD